MAVTVNSIVSPQAIQNDFQSIVNADGAVGTTLTTSPSNAKLLCTAGANGNIVKSITVCSDDSTARVLVFYISPDAGTTKYPLGSVNIPINSGATGAIAGIDILGSSMLPGLTLDQAGKPIIELAPTYRIYVGTQVAVTAAKFINVTCQSEVL